MIYPIMDVIFNWTFLFENSLYLLVMKVNTFVQIFYKEWIQWTSFIFVARRMCPFYWLNILREEGMRIMTEDLHKALITSMPLHACNLELKTFYWHQGRKWNPWVGDIKIIKLLDYRVFFLLDHHHSVYLSGSHYWRFYRFVRL